MSWEEIEGSGSFDCGRISGQWLRESLGDAAAAILDLIEWIVRLNSGHGA